jgi:hypothetical protein
VRSRPQLVQQSGQSGDSALDSREPSRSLSPESTLRSGLASKAVPAGVSRLHSTTPRRTARLVRHDRVPGVAVMNGGVPALRRFAALRASADQALAQFYPGRRLDETVVTGFRGIRW